MKLGFKVINLEEGLKYLGFHLKPSYRISDWEWLTIKCEKRLENQCVYWVSKGVIMTLIKSVLTTIPVYCFLSWILSCMLDKIAKLSMRLFWPGSFKNKRNVWISWKMISIPILMGGWDIKNLIPFSKDFVVKRKEFGGCQETQDSGLNWWNKNLSAPCLS